MYQNRGDLLIKKNINNAIIIVNHIFQISILLGLMYLQSLTRSKALVMRHLFQRKLDFEAHFLSNTGIMIQSLLISLLMISAAMYLKKRIQLKKGYFGSIETGLFIMNGLFILSVLHLNFFKNLLVYGYLVIGLYLILIIQSINIKITINDWKDE